MSGFEDKYRRKVAGGEPAAMSPGPEAKAPAELPKEEYKAFFAAANPKFNLWVRTNAANKNTDTSLPYGRMNHMITDGNGFVVSLHYDTPVISVTIQGRNLGELHEKLLEHEVHWVMEFDPRRWATPSEDAPCITGIDIKRKPLPENSEDALNSEPKSPGKAAAH